MDTLGWFTSLFLLPALAAPWFRGKSPPRWPFVVALVAVVGALVVASYGERGWRWMPLLVLTLAVGVVATVSLVRRSSDRSRRWLVTPASLAGLAAWLVSVALPWAIPQTTLPTTGPYHVGTVTYVWTDASRAETYTDDPGDHRELPVQVWYPTDETPRAGHREVEGAKVAASAGRCPVLVFVHGGTSMRGNNLSAYHELASHGYVVAAADHTHISIRASFPDGRTIGASPVYLKQLQTLAERDLLARMAAPEFQQVLDVTVGDVRFELDSLERLETSGEGPLAGHLDLSRVGLFGHSLGAATIGQACREDARCDAALILDGVLPKDVVSIASDGTPTLVDTPYPRPVMFIQTQHMIDDAQAGPAYITSRTAFERARGPAYYGVMADAGHMNVSDLPLVLAPPVARLLTGGDSGVGAIDPQRSVAIVDTLALAFFDRHLRDEPAALDDQIAAIDEVRFEVR